MNRAAGLLDVVTFRVPADLIAGGHELIRRAGSKGYECLVLWAGRRDPDSPMIFDVVMAFAPAQVLMRSEDGVGLHVEPDELLRINRALYADRLQLAGQVHSHPMDAYHSETDDAHSVVTIAGGLSLVVPDFAAASFRIATTAVYRLSPAGTWDSVAPRTAERLVEITE
jgi:hypothetical protein